MGKYLKFYEKCMKTGVMPEKGLCSSLGKDKVDVFDPTTEDWQYLVDQRHSLMYWGSGLSCWDVKRHYTFTPLRQNMVLFLAAMNNEL